MPGHWLLARMGKRVLRPGGLELTRRMLDALDIRASDDVVELAPGLGVTARAALDREPRSYVGIERDEAAGTCAATSAVKTGGVWSAARKRPAALLAAQGFVVETQISAPMHLLEPRRFIRDEGLVRTLRFLWNVARTPAARRRIRAMRATFRRYAEHLAATAIVAVKG